MRASVLLASERPVGRRMADRSQQGQRPHSLQSHAQLKFERIAGVQTSTKARDQRRGGRLPLYSGRRTQALQSRDASRDGSVSNAHWSPCSDRRTVQRCLGISECGPRNTRDSLVPGGGPLYKIHVTARNTRVSGATVHAHGAF